MWPYPEILTEEDGKPFDDDDTMKGKGLDWFGFPISSNAT